jgi:D-tyrosyl-tRNA(Tyr) deacylase
MVPKESCPLRIVIQRVASAQVEVNGQIIGSIQQGLLVLVGVAHQDSEAESRWLANKTAELRVFEDDQGKMNRSLIDIGGSALVVSQFTLLADCRRGRRPAFTDAAPPALAEQLYLRFAEFLAERGIEVQSGIFAAEMQVSLINDGPVTIVIDRIGEHRER